MQNPFPFLSGEFFCFFAAQLRIPRRACWVLDSPYWDTVLRSLVLPAEIFAPSTSCRSWLRTMRTSQRNCSSPEQCVIKCIRVWNRVIRIMIKTCQDMSTHVKTCQELRIGQMNRIENLRNFEALKMFSERIWHQACAPLLFPPLLFPTVRTCRSEYAEEVFLRPAARQSSCLKNSKRWPCTSEALRAALQCSSRFANNKENWDVQIVIIYIIV